jgi:hypothetical protein
LFVFLGSISPSVYRKAKQAPEEKREEILIKELKELLAKEGLSANPSEKGNALHLRSLLYLQESVDAFKIF